MHTDPDAITSFRVKLIMAQSRREAVLQQKVDVAAKSARFKTQSDFTEILQIKSESTEMSPAELKKALEASLIENAQMTLKIAQLVADKEALTAKLEESEAKMEASRDKKHESFYENPKKAYAWVIVGNDAPNSFETKTASSSVPPTVQTIGAPEKNWEML